MCAVLAVLATIGVTACSGPKDSSNGTSTPGASNWTDVTSWDGEGNGDSPQFRISTDVWRVLWDAAPDEIGQGEFVVHIYNDDGTFFLNLFDSKEHGANIRKGGPITGTLGVEGQGDFFLRIMTTRSYEVTIQERR